MKVRTAKSSSTISAALGRDLQDFCATLGVELEPLLGPLGLEASAFSSFEERINFDAFCRLMEVLAALSGRETFGIEYAEFFRPGGTGVLGQGLNAAPTIEAVFRFLTKSMIIMVDHRYYDVIYEPDVVIVEWSYSPLIARNEQFIYFAVSLVVQQLARITEGRQTYRAFNFRHQAPANVKKIKAAFPGPVSFGKEANSVRLRTNLFDMVNPNADPILFDFMQQSCDKILSKRRFNKPMDVSLREDIMESLRFGGMTVDQAAVRFGMSKRTLQRRLEDLGVTYEGLVDEVRGDLIEAMLKDTDQSMAQIAETVGYSDQSAFSRAVVTRFKQTPTQLRAQLIKDN